MKVTFVLIIALLSLALLHSCGPKANKSYSFEIGGPCAQCPATRLDSILKSNESIVTSNYDPKTGILKIDVDSTGISTSDLKKLLRDSGYEVDLDVAFMNPTEPAFACCDTDGASAADGPDVEIDEEDAEIDEIGSQIEKELDDELSKEFAGLDDEIEKLGSGGASTVDQESLDEETDFTDDDLKGEPRAKK
jgi:hypothetical protein